MKRIDGILILIFFNLAAWLSMLQVAAAQQSYEAANTYSIVLTPSPLAFGKVAVGSSAIRTETVSNPGAKKVVLTGAAVAGTGFSIKSHPIYPYTLSAGTSVNFRIRFSPTTTGYVSGNITVYYKYLSAGSWHRTSRTIQTSGTGTTSAGALAASPVNLSFGTVSVSNTKTLSETLTNAGAAAVTISQMVVTGVGYSFSGINPPLTLSSGQSALFRVTFKPKTTGSAGGKLTISSNANNPTLSVSLSGTGVTPGQIAVSPASINFGNVVVGTTQTKSGTVSATNGPVTISGANFSGSEFSIAGISFPFMMSAGQTASYNLTFTPSASGSATGTVTWVSNATNAAPTQSLSGTGTPAPTHSVTLDWHASTSASVVGYNIYRATKSGGPYTQINTALDSGLQDIDYNVQGGSIYYYVVTAVDSAGKESTYSSQVKAVIPYP